MLEGRILICKAKSILHPHSGWFCVSRVTRAQQAKASKQKAPPTGGALKCSFVTGRDFALVAHRRARRARHARRAARTRELTPPREQQQSRR